MRLKGFALSALLIAGPVTAQVNPEPGASGLFVRGSGGGYAPAMRLESSVEIEVTLVGGNRRIEGEIQEREADYGRFTMLPATATDSRWYQLVGTVLAALLLGLYGIWRLTRRLRS